MHIDILKASKNSSIFQTADFYQNIDLSQQNGNDKFYFMRSLPCYIKWVTREKVKVDRIACPWLIKRFVDPKAEFLFVHPDKVLDVTEKEGAVPFDVKGAELGDHWIDGNEYVSFDAILRKYGLREPALLELSKIVRGADSAFLYEPLESDGLKAIAEGFRRMTQNDAENMGLQFPVYDPLYEYCKAKLAETFAG